MEQNGLYSEEYGENGYMEQEEEWEREGLLDPAWEKQQKKVSESYINSRRLQMEREKFVCKYLTKKTRSDEITIE